MLNTQGSRAPSSLWIISIYDQPFAANEVSQNGYTKGRLTNLEMTTYGNVQAGYSNGQDVVLGKIMVTKFCKPEWFEAIEADVYFNCSKWPASTWRSS